MSPYPAQVDIPTILERARELIEADGVDQLTLGKLAASLNIKAPSLYKHIASKAELIKAVNTITAQQLQATLSRVIATAPDGRLDWGLIRPLALAYRSFALENPTAYSLLFSNLAPESRPDEQLMEAIAIPLQALMAQVSGPEPSLAALRGALALLHGFVTLELNGQFKRGGDVQAAFLDSFDAYLAGWQGNPPENKNRR